jgi:hypothetical protein
VRPSASGAAAREEWNDDGATLRDRLEQLAALLSQREPLPGEPWTVFARLDERVATLLRQPPSPAEAADALSWVDDAPADDPARRGAALAWLTAGDAPWLPGVERLLREAPGNDATAWYLCGALSLGAGSLAGVFETRALQQSAQPTLRRVAAEMALRQRVLAEPELLTLCRDDVSAVADAALLALAWNAPTHGALAELLTDAAGDERRWPAYWLAAALAGGRDGRNELAAHAFAALPDHAERAAFAVALLADENAAGRLLAACAAKPSRALIAALGWAGSPGCIALLLGLLSADEPLGIEAAHALERIVGPGPRDELQVEPESLLRPTALVAPFEGLLQCWRSAAAVDGGAPLVEGASADALQLPSLSADAWRAHLESRPVGGPHDKHRCIDELRSSSSSSAERQLLVYDLALRCSIRLRDVPHGLATRQHAELDGVRGHDDDRRDAAGSWCLAELSV